jgi:hypothetical protein
MSLIQCIPLKQRKSLWDLHRTYTRGDDRDDQRYIYVNGKHAVVNTYDWLHVHEMYHRIA